MISRDMSVRFHKQWRYVQQRGVYAQAPGAFSVLLFLFVSVLQAMDVGGGSYSMESGRGQVGYGGCCIETMRWKSTLKLQTKPEVKPEKA